MDNAFFQQPMFGVSLTVIVYAIAQGLHKKWSKVHPLFITSAGIIAILLICGIPYESYRVGGDYIALLLGPATVGLGVPLYKQTRSIGRNLPAILAGLTTGSISALVCAGGITWSLGAAKNIWVTMIPKSVTTPISVEIVRHLGGIPELGVIVTTLTGLLGSMIGPELLRLCGVRSDIAIGTAIGTASHGIGTARLVKESELQAGVSGFAMAATGIFISLLVIPLYWIL
ncbi:LrgB family protein [Paenibacillus chondroitinus]|uniref:LrgB family protein n=1 Tax=Paenibacillus chondroitinus TaxID=59842 RepID=A0ABU6D5M4_9BACL|nr:LrgB family protein [Paenibacillus chondroitinus]MCY9660108.1 LrgB family protein [Paenibacillus anseongense]MEB4793033.1 LrgB family protein [Paenibacillus chondroitinus]